MNKLSPLIVVEDVTLALPFWCDTLGFAKVAEVPHQGSVGFAILKSGEVEIMLQSVDSVRADLGAAFVPSSSGYQGMMLYVELDSLEALLDRVGERLDIVAGPRSTSYGMHEVWVRSPEGLLVGLAARASEA